ncbi:hypothetical protein MG1_04941 [Candida albicans GC75]|nr:hypothetical protein MG1_04941 [Candida albicans GC75]
MLQAVQLSHHQEVPIRLSLENHQIQQLQQPSIGLSHMLLLLQLSLLQVVSTQ